MNFRNEKILKAFAANFKRIRASKKITQEELAYISGVSLSQIARIETGRINPTVCTLFILAKHLKVEPKELLGFDVKI